MKATKNIIYNFNPFTVEVAERRIWRDKELVSLTPKAFDTLLVLLANRGKVVDKDVLLNEVWQDTFVDESTLAQNISTLRKVLGAVSDGKQFIETVPRHGYRFVAEVREIIGEEEIIVVEHRVRTQISAEHKKYSDEIIIQPEKHVQEISLTKIFRTWIEKNKVHFAVAVLAICVTAAIVSIGIGYYLKASPLSTTSFRHTEITKLSSNGNIQLVKVSPDGNYLALVEKRGENSALLLGQIGGSTTIEIVPPKRQQFLGVTFSPDGKQIYYTIYDREKNNSGELIGQLYKISSLGGQVQEITEDIDSPIAISPDGKQFAFIRNYLKEKQSVVIIADFDTKEEKKLTFRHTAKFFAPRGLAWSPNGKTIVALAFDENRKMEVIGIDAVSGEQKSLISERWEWISSPNWLADGSGLVVAAYTNNSGDKTDEIWKISFPEGTTQKIAGGISGIYGLSLTNDSRYIVAVKSETLSGFWESSSNDLKQSVKIKQNLRDYDINLPGMSWAPDGKVVYGASLNGNLDIWMMDADGSHNKQITTSDGADSMPIVSADGKYIYFISNRSGKMNLWRMKVDGGEQKQLTDEDEVYSPSLSSDGNYVFYASPDKSSPHQTLHRISIEGGQPTQLTSLTTQLPQVSPDGKLIACYYVRPSASGDLISDLKPTILSAETGQVIKQFNADFDGFQEHLSSISWSDNQNFNYVTTNGGGSSLWRQSIDKDSPQITFDSPDEKIFRFAWTKDGKSIVYEKGTSINDVLLIKSVDN